mgnify:CR=1 FL=1|tara:strand:+ start:12003 stop:12695 length:693 start_codon:yes stop_codon:yes gene_type:complete
MSEFTLKDYYVEQFELTPNIVREVLVFVASEKFNDTVNGISLTDCCSESKIQTVGHETKNGTRYTVECPSCGAKSAMAKSELMAKLSWYQKFSDWDSLSSNPLFRINLVDKIDSRDTDSQIYLSLELLAGLNMLNRLHDANKKRFDAVTSVKQKMNLDVVSVLIRSAQKSISFRLDELGLSLKDSSSQKRLKGISDKLFEERVNVISGMTEVKRSELSELISLFKDVSSK